MLIGRRDFLRLSAAAGAGALLGCGSDVPLIPPAGSGFPVSALSGSRVELDGPLTVLAGEVPRDLLGHALVNASLPYGDGTPLFTGDAMVYRLSFAGGAVHLRSKVLSTPCQRLDAAAGDDSALRFRNSGFVRLSQAFGARNFGNTALVPIQDGRLLATYDAGRPWEIDPVTLEVITPVGLQDTWSPFLPEAEWAATATRRTRASSPSPTTTRRWAPRRATCTTTTGSTGWSRRAGWRG